MEGGQTTLYLRSTVLGGQVVGEYNQSGTWLRGYVYDGTGQLLAMQAGGVQWVHQDPVTKSKRVTDRWGNSIAAIDVDPWGGETSRMENGGAISRKYTTYERDGNGRDQAMQRSYHAWFSRFDQPDPSDGSYDMTNPQSFNRYAYVHNDPVNFTDPSGLDEVPFVDGGTVTVTGNYYDYALHERALSGGRLAGGIRPRRLLPLDPRRRGAIEPQKPTPDNVTSNQDVLDTLYCLWKLGGYGTKDTERSTWITNNGGIYGSVAWPWSAESKKETWKGPIPAGTVANAHTHPNSGGVKPSTSGGNTGKGDQGTADKIGLPVYVVTRNAIWKAVPNGKNPVQVAGNDWWKPSEKAKVKCK